MAAVAAPSDHTVEMMQNLSLDSQNNPHQVNDHSNKNAPVQYASFVNGAQSNGSGMQFDRSPTPFRQDFLDPNVYTYPSSTYFYGAFNGSSVGEWDRYGNPNGVEMPSAVYNDYQNGYSYAPYGPYSSSGAPLGHDSQLYLPQQYQYPTPYFQPSAVNSSQYTPNHSNASRSDVASIGADQMQLSTGLGLANQSSVGNVSNNRVNMSQSLRPNPSKPSAKANDFYRWGSYPSAGSGNSSAFSYESNLPLERNLGLQSFPHLMGMQHPHTASGMDHARFGNRMYTNNRMYGQYPSTLKSSAGYIPTNNYSRNGRAWIATDNKYKIRGSSNSLSVYGNGNADGRNELNKGPRGKSFKDLKDSEPITIAVRGQSLPVKAKSVEDKSPVFLDKEQYNRDDFAEALSDAKFFVIKSYSEDDVHKSIKYGVWASTPNGNKKLDAAYKEAQEKSGGCPVFLLFSVNASGQFVGVAEMVGPVDFDQCVEYWQQDKWTGCFAVKWHIVKDVPNSMLRHITLENNENKPVTNSRDTQEVKFEQGIEIIKILKGHSSKTCILDDFEFYEGRQKTMQERKAKQKQFEKQVGGITLPGTNSADTSTDKTVLIGDADNKAVET